MTWIWDPSTSADVVAYVLYLCVAVTPGQCSPWVEIAETPLLTYTHEHPEIARGACFVYDVEARDLAGNESER